MKKDIVNTEIIAKEYRVGILRVDNVNYISLTDLARQANSEDSSGVIRNWMSNKNSFDYYSLWEEIKIDKVTSGKYSKGTFAHPDIAFEFASWLALNLSYI